MRTKLVIGLTVGGLVAATGVAWAVLGGVLITPDAVQGIVTGGGSGSCQNSGVTFTVPDPTWSNTDGDYVVASIGYSGIATACVSLGTADLVLNITDGSPTSIATATASNLSSANGTLTLSTAISFDEATTGQYRYLVKDN